MLLTANLLHTAIVANFPLMSLVSLMPLVRGAVRVSACVGVMAFFKPLLSGIVRALVLVVRPRRSREENARRRLRRDAQLLQRMINTSHGSSHAAELQAMAARAM